MVPNYFCYTNIFNYQELITSPDRCRFLVGLGPWHPAFATEDFAVPHTKIIRCAFRKRTMHAGGGVTVVRGQQGANRYRRSAPCRCEITKRYDPMQCVCDRKHSRSQMIFFCMPSFTSFSFIFLSFFSYFPLCLYCSFLTIWFRLPKRYILAYLFSSPCTLVTAWLQWLIPC